MMVVNQPDVAVLHSQQGLVLPLVWLCGQSETQRSKVSVASHVIRKRLTEDSIPGLWYERLFSLMA